MKIFEDEHQWLAMTLAKQEPFEGIERPAPALRGIKSRPLEIIDPYVEKREKDWQCGLQSSVQGQDLADDLLTDLLRVVPRVDLKAALQQFDEGK
jgi:hypothetical protein